jgi:hypothetical protein
MQALEETLRRQADHTGQWALFLTFRNVKDDWEATALETFLKNLQDNLDSHPKVLECFAKKYNMSNVKALAGGEVEAAVTQSVIKWLVDRGHAYNLEVARIRSYYYVRYVNKDLKYTITKLILQFRRGGISPHIIPTKATPRQSWMDDDLTKSITQNNNSDVEEALIKSPDNVLDELTKEIEELVKSVDESSRTVLLADTIGSATI